jgi:CheY-like chemotaxis protein
MNPRTLLAGLKHRQDSEHEQALIRATIVLLLGIYMVAAMLEHFGLEANTATNGKEAVEAFRAAPYNLVLMDCQMPEMDGFQATNGIRRLESERGGTTRVLVVALTAHMLPGDKDRCLAAGMDDYLGKPCRMKDLKAVLDRWLPPWIKSGA